MIDIGSYDYATAQILTEARVRDAAATEAMRNYGVDGYGVQLVEHQERVARDAANFWLELGGTPREAANIEAALRLHDWGKTHSSYDPAIWRLEDRPTKEQKKLQKRHTEFGARMLDDMVADMGETRNHPHIKLRRDLTLYHHERIDGTGPQGVDASTLPLWVQVACIADAYDGDMIPRPHQDHQRTPQEELDRLTGKLEAKYNGAFTPELVAKYVRYKAKALKIPLTELASHATVAACSPSPH